MKKNVLVGSEQVRLADLRSALAECSSDLERIEVLNADPVVLAWAERPSPLRTYLAGASQECELALKSMIAVGGEELLTGDMPAEALRAMLDDLLKVEHFYKQIGGIVGYHDTLHGLLKASAAAKGPEKYLRPPSIDISKETDAVKKYILEGIASLPKLGEMYPVGGAADRLKLFDPATGQPLPAALLVFCGHNLLEWLVRDVQAREYLYYKHFGKQVTVPIAMMTSPEKDDHRFVVGICEANNWFGRPKESIRFFCQPMVPAIDKEGNWCLGAPMKLLMKPGGHGVIWKMAKDEGILSWMEDLGKKKLLVRQINNPIAGTDYGLLAFCGVGFSKDKAFGFASCPRQVGAAEGMNVLIEKPGEYCLTNIEYCDFKKFDIQDVPMEPGSSYSQFPSNTNILFADIGAVSEAVECNPVPGMLVNLKAAPVVGKSGQIEQKEVGRLESVMQNIADCLVSPDQSALSTFLTFNERRKTISTTKKQYTGGPSLIETPDGCLFDLLLNAHELLATHCSVQVPDMPDQQAFLASGPSFLFTYHPALGPLYSVIAQKVRGGKWAAGSELKLEIADAEIENLTLDGSLHIIADQVMGEIDEEGILRYSEKVGKCRLVNVTVRNGGIDRSASNVYWKGEIAHHEMCAIAIHGDGEFYAENVVLPGNLRIDVPAGTRLIAYEEKGQLRFRLE